jgi:DEAD/DEAH box helicase domain-containing protein
MKDLRNLKVCFFDIECREDVDGKRNKFDQAQHLGIAVACTLTSDGEYRDWINDDCAFRLFSYLTSFDAVVTYNGCGFDYPVLGGCLLGEYHLAAAKYIEMALKGKTIDLCIDFREALGARVSLQNVVVPTLGESKTMDGAYAPEKWRKGQCLEVIHYCRGDVSLTKKLFDKAINGEDLQVLDKAGNKKSFRVSPKIR